MVSFFQNRIAVLATMHRKEEAIAPILEKEIGVQVVVPSDFDTDQFGTFTRDRDRPGTQLEAARLKAEKVLELTGETLAIASEGSFAPHPSFPAIPCNRELVLLLDRQNNLEIVGWEISTETNYSHATIQSLEEALQFARQAEFPTHGLVVMMHQSSKTPEEIFKGITTEAELEAAVMAVLERSANGRIHIETDMRAHQNPTRMGVIAKATMNLIQAIQRACPVCSTPGFELVEHRPGLLCELCGSPTNLTRVAVYHCKTCGSQQDILYPDGIQMADPTYCNFCNP